MVSGTRVELMLTSLGFRGNPFALREADREGLEHLAGYFFEHPIFSEVLGSAQNPESVVVLARRGAGKTTFRQAIEMYCRTSQEPVSGILDVPYVDFSRPISIARRRGVAPDVSLHVDEILRCAFVRWLDSLNEDQAVRLLQRWRNDEMATLKAYLLRYTSLFRAKDFGRTMNQLFRRVARESLGEEFEGDIASAILEGADWHPWLPGSLHPLADFMVRLAAQAPRALPQSSYSQLVRDFLDLCEPLGCAGVYVLVDRLDETSLLPDAEQVVSFVAPLLTDLVLLDEARLAFKVFLPQHLSDLLYSRVDFRPKRLSVQHLVWTADDLLQLLARRLLAFSPYNSMQILCEPSLGSKLAQLSNRFPRARYVDVTLVQASNNLPRDLVLRCRKLLEIYEVSDTPGLINEDHLDEAINADLGRDEPRIEIRPVDSAAPAQAATTRTPSDREESFSQHGLYVDARKRVWRDGRVLQDQPSATEFRLLSYLCDHRYEICSYEDILEAVWSQGGDTTMLNTTLRRLRKVVEYDPAHPSFIIRHIGRGIQLTDGFPGAHELAPT